MSVLYKGYSVPKAAGRHVDMGMAFKKDELKPKRSVPSRRPKRKPGELKALVLSFVTDKWKTALDISADVDAARENIRVCLERLVESGCIQSVGAHKTKTYRRVK